MFWFFKISCCSVAVPFGASYFFFNEMNTFILQGCIKLIKINSKDFYIVKKKNLIFLKMLVFWTLYSLNYIYFFKYTMISTKAQLFSTVIMIVNFSWAQNISIK